MSNRILIVEESPSASGTLLAKNGFQVTTARPSEAVARAFETGPELILFPNPGGSAAVADTLGAVHDVPMLFLGATRAQVRPRARRQIAPAGQPLLNAVRGALLSR